VKQRIAEILLNYRKRKITRENLKSSAVLVPLFCNEGQCHVLFTQRSNEVKFHKGQVCFPGGTFQPGDTSLLQTDRHQWLCYFAFCCFYTPPLSF